LQKGHRRVFIDAQAHGSVLGEQASSRETKAEPKHSFHIHSGISIIFENNLKLKRQ
jgi:hypothetical protein